MNTDIFFLFLTFQSTTQYFWMIMWTKNMNNFQIAKLQHQGVPQHLLEFFANFSLALLLKVLLINNKTCSVFQQLIINQIIREPSNTVIGNDLKQKLFVKLEFNTSSYLFSNEMKNHTIIIERINPKNSIKLGRSIP